jgi:hypothetical protein
VDRRSFFFPKGQSHKTRHAARLREPGAMTSALQDEPERPSFANKCRLGSCLTTGSSSSLRILDGLVNTCKGSYKTKYLLLD